jgi:hypothetical protein
MSVGIREVTAMNADAARVARDMRLGDVRELEALTLTRPYEALARSIGMSQEAYIGYWNDVPVAVFGCHTTALARIGVPWLLGTQTLSEHPIPFVKMAKRYISHLKETHTKLLNVVHEENTPSILFLHALGFAIHDPHLSMTGAKQRVFDMEGTMNV